MSYQTLDYSKSGYPSSFAPKRVSHFLAQDTEAGYSQTSPSFTRDYWSFSVGWAAMSPDSYVYLMNFFHSHRGGQFFYFRWPTGIFGADGSTSGLSDTDALNAPGIYEADPGGVFPFSSEIAQGFGYSPIQLVRFDIQELEATLINARKNLWTVNVVLRQT